VDLGKGVAKRGNLGLDWCGGQTVGSVRRSATTGGSNGD
jgi:hypothetical protein